MIRSVIIGFFLLISTSACEKASVKGDWLIIYKTRQDYSRNIYIRLNSDKTKTIVFPSLDGLDTIKLPVKLSKGYFLGTQRNGENGVKSVVTSLTIDTYKTYITPDSLTKLVIDYDPFLEYYECTDNSTIDKFRNNLGIDTTKLNEMINNNELTKYFNRLK